MSLRQILIVEDEPIIGFALEEIVETLGWSVAAVATRVGQALELLEHETPNAAILDVNLHGEKSYPIADRLAELSVPFVFATGYGDIDHPGQHCRVPTLNKPYTADQVGMALSQLA